MANYNKFSAFIEKVCKSGVFFVFFVIFCAMQLFGCSVVMFQNGYSVIAIANIVNTLLLICLYLCARLRE